METPIEETTFKFLWWNTNRLFIYFY